MHHRPHPTIATLLLLTLAAPLTSPSHAAPKDTTGAALTAAVRRGDDAAVAALLNGGANANIATAGMTPLIWAAIMNRPSTVELLLTHGANVNGAVPSGHDAGLTPLIAAANGRNNIYSGAAELPAPAIYAGKDSAKRRLYQAAVRAWRGLVTQWRSQYAAIVKLLIAHRANVNAQMAIGTTAIDSAATASDTDTVRFLLSEGARLDLPSHEADILGKPHDATNGYYALVGAIYEDKHNPELVKLLLTHGANPNSASPSEMTPLGAAASSGDIAIVKLLLDHGARPGDQDFYGRTALSYATSHPTIATLLEKAAQSESKESIFPSH